MSVSSGWYIVEGICHSLFIEVEEMAYTLHTVCIESVPYLYAVGEEIAYELYDECC